MKEIRLLFEPKEGTNVNHNEMFRHYASSWLDGFDEARYGGHISMDLGDKVGDIMEPVYQFIFDEPTDACYTYLDEYITRNPLCGYYVHMYTRYPKDGESKHAKVYGIE